ncbi:transporter [Streptomyces sp. NPDC096311]|uniref:sodium:solute symporter family transporter n=1 Tax=Streptomyces sp. NPDC096311 TaxID=3366083 RepID=UPI00381DB927
MTVHSLSVGAIDSLGANARVPVITAYLSFVAVVLLWLLMSAATEIENPESFYVAGRSLSPSFNGIAIAGESITVLTLLGFSGNITLSGYDGFSVAIDILLALGVLLFLAQRIRNSGRYSLGDLFSLRAAGSGPCIAGNLVTLAITIPLLMVQLHAAGVSTALLIGLDSTHSQIVCTVLMGGFVTCVASAGGLRGTSLMHIVKVFFAIAVLVVIAVLSLSSFGWDPGRLLLTAVEKSAVPDKYLTPGFWKYSQDFKLGPLNTISNHAVLILGVAMMPHLILRINASRNGRSARRSVAVAAVPLGMFVLLLIAVGFAAAAVVGGKNTGMADLFGPSFLISLASGLVSNGSAAGVALITAIACVVFLALITSVASITFAAAVSLVHDLQARGERRRTSGTEVRSVRIAAVVVGATGVLLSAVTHKYPLEFLSSFSLCVAASCIFPPLIYSFFWVRFNRRGLLWSVYGGLLLCVMLTVFSPTVSGKPFSLFPEGHFDWYPLQSPGLVSIPAAFFLGWLGSQKAETSPAPDFRYIEHQALTGNEAGLRADT